MALNMASFKTRTLTAIVFVVVMAAGILLSGWGFLLLVSVIHFGCWTEYQKLVEKIDPRYKSVTGLHKYLAMLLGWSFVLFATGEKGPWRVGGLTVSEIVFWPMIALLVIFFIEGFARNKAKNVAHSIMGLVYISLTLAAFVDIADAVVIHYPFAITWFESKMWLMPSIVIATMWVNDTLAYIVGSLIGKTPLSPISPKKTWEGTIGGIILATLIIGLLLVYQFEWDAWAYVLPACMAITGTIGDLFESKLKRLAGVKDSGTMMPGHGGFLDRFDSLLFAAPTAWIIITLYNVISDL